MDLPVVLTKNIILDVCNLKILCLNWPIALRKIYLLSFFENGDKSKKTSAVLTLRPESCIGKSIAR